MGHMDVKISACCTLHTGLQICQVRLGTMNEEKEQGVMKREQMDGLRPALRAPKAGMPGEE